MNIYEEMQDRAYNAGMNVIGYTFRNKTIKGFLNDALDAYKSKYRVYTIVDNYAIYFIPALLVLERK